MKIFQSMLPVRVTSLLTIIIFSKPALSSSVLQVRAPRWNILIGCMRAHHWEKKDSIRHTSGAEYNFTFICFPDLTALEKQWKWPSCQIPISIRYAEFLYSAPAAWLLVQHKCWRPVIKSREIGETDKKLEGAAAYHFRRAYLFLNTAPLRPQVILIRNFKTK